MAKKQKKLAKWLKFVIMHGFLALILTFSIFCKTDFFMIISDKMHFFLFIIRIYLKNIFLDLFSEFFQQELS